jgi:tryptophan synthase beta subunit
MKYTVNENGYYGEFGGAWIPEMMYTNIDELKRRYLEIIEADDFKAEFNQLMKDYVGRPSPLYFTKRVVGTLRLKNLSETRRPEPHRFTQTQQHHGANPAGTKTG